MYDMAVCHWGMSPRDVWDMTPAEWWRIYEVKRPRDKDTDYAGSLSQEDVERLNRMMKNGNKRNG
ncbi:phage tail assembly chaperone [Bordetella genomosp. 7]|uniref:phage tail assembly chaperone n=1 Tax=Bordetella genomosp. 7 TaxID=1416805 RepID=UPI0011405609